MRRLRTTTLAALCALAAGLVLAQPAGMGPGMGPGKGGPGAGRWGADATPGWSMMTPEERNAHRDRMQAARTYDECKGVQAEHHQQMQASATEQGKTLPAPRRDPCIGLPK